MGGLEFLSNVMLGWLIISLVILVTFFAVVVVLFLLAFFSPDWFAENIKGMYEDVS